MGAFVELGFKYIRTYIVLRFIRKTKQELSSSGLMSSSLLERSGFARRFSVCTAAQSSSESPWISPMRAFMRCLVALVSKSSISMSAR